MAFAQSHTLDLDDGWQMQSTVLVKEEAQTVSSSVFETKNWYPTKPGWTVLNTLTKSGVYPDMRFGMNNYQIPDISDTFNEKHDLARFSHLPNRQNPWASPWWFRKMFSLKNAEIGKAVWLEMDCINYRAEIWFNGQMIANHEQVAGMFQRFQYNIRYENDLTVFKELFGDVIHDRVIFGDLKAKLTLSDNGKRHIVICIPLLYQKYAGRCNHFSTG